MIETTNGPMDEATLTRSVILHDRPSGLALWIEYRVGSAVDGDLVRRDAFPLPKNLDANGQVFTTKGFLPPQTPGLTRVVLLSENDNELVVEERFTLDGELVSNSPHVILKHPSVTASALAAALV